jgi:hypothetical protein
VSARRGWRLLAAVGVALGVMLVPVRGAAACDCALVPLPQAIQDAEIAIVGTLVSQDPVLAPDPAGQPQELTWRVERSRDSLSVTEVAMRAWPDDGANCGVSFSADERWLVLAYQGDWALETNGCMRNARMADLTPEEAELVDAAVAVSVGTGPPTSGEPSVSLPAPLLVVAGAIVLLAMVSILAFRRPGSAASA